MRRLQGVSWKSIRVHLWALAALAGIAGLTAPAGAQEAGTEGDVAYSIELSGTIDPATRGWIEDALEDATDEGAELVIVRIDTPGGLVDSMREIVKDLIAAPQPVVAYVFPDGAQAASAGLFITQAADVAAMAPQTNIGSASPVSIGPGGASDIDETLERKIENDAAAYVRALTEEHDRNGDLAEEMVREATNVTAAEALEAELIDIVASSQEELLSELDGFQVQGPKAQTLDTEGFTVTERDMPLHVEILQLLVNPNIAFILMLAGFAGIAIEVFNPGTFVPGSLGAIALVLGLFGTAQLPVTIAGVLLLLLGVGLIVAETQIPSGFLGAAGVVALAVGGLLLFDTDSDALAVSPEVVIILSIVIGAGLIFVVRKVREAHQGPVHTGWEEMVGAEGVVRAELDPRGQVFAGGALWRAVPAAEGERIGRGDRVRVESVDGLTLRVSRVDDSPGEGESQPEGDS